MQSELISQGHQLRAVLATVEHARAGLLPPVGAAGWHGAAHTLYALGLVRVHEDAAVALDYLRLAIRRTQLAIDGAESCG